MEAIGERLATVPGVIAVTLGGSRARGTHTSDSDWDFGLYYRESIDVDAIRALGYQGEIMEPGAWGPMNGGAWLTIDGERVDLIYRGLDDVERQVAEAEAGEFTIELLGGFIAGFASYVPVGELAINKVLVGELPRPSFPDALRESAPPRWRDRAAFSIRMASASARRGYIAHCGGLLARAAIEESQARMAERGEWALNEKGLVATAGLGEVDYNLAALGSRFTELMESVERTAMILGVRLP